MFRLIPPAPSHEQHDALYLFLIVYLISYLLSYALTNNNLQLRFVDYNTCIYLQMGLPADKEQYIHRLGRTGRKGKGGLGILLLAPWEEYFLSTIRDLPISKASLPSVDPDTKRKVHQRLHYTLHFLSWCPCVYKLGSLLYMITSRKSAA